MSLLPNTLVGLPALLGVLLGLAIYVNGETYIPIAAGLLVLPLCLTAIGHISMHRQPKLARWLIESCIFSAAAAVAFGTAIVAWVSLESPLLKILDLEAFTSDEQKTLSGVFIGAVTSFLALVWMKDIGEGKGFFWPSTQFQSAIGAAYRRLKPEPGGTSTVYQASFEPAIDGHGMQGWGFGARAIRAAVFQAHLDSPVLKRKPAAGKAKKASRAHTSKPAGKKGGGPDAG